jgi:hypothetical protein
MRARAQKERWREEFVIVGYEMKWTVNHFMYQSNQWVGRGIASDHDQDRGGMAYAAKQAARWAAIAKQAEVHFQTVNEQYRAIVT